MLRTQGAAPPQSLALSCARDVEHAKGTEGHWGLSQQGDYWPSLPGFLSTCKKSPASALGWSCLSWVSLYTLPEAHLSVGL